MKTDEETNELCLQWVLCISGIMAQGVLLLVYGISREAQEGEWSYCMPIQEEVIGVLAHPAEHLEAHK